MYNYTVPCIYILPSLTPRTHSFSLRFYLSKRLHPQSCSPLPPTFVTFKVDPTIDQMRCHIPPVSLVASRIPRLVLEDTYGIRLPHPQEAEDLDQPPYAEELCGAYMVVSGLIVCSLKHITCRRLCHRVVNVALTGL